MFEFKRVHYAEEGLHAGDLFPLCENARKGDGMTFFATHVTCEGCHEALHNGSRKRPDEPEQNGRSSE